MLSVPMIKVCAQVVAGFGVSKVVLQVIRNNTTIVTLTDAILVRAGTLVLGSIAIDQATSHVSKFVDDVVEGIERRKVEVDGEKDTPEGEVVNGDILKEEDVVKEKVNRKTNGA